jgi:hypothetical protein
VHREEIFAQLQQANRTAAQPSKTAPDSPSNAQSQGPEPGPDDRSQHDR